MKRIFSFSLAACGLLAALSFPLGAEVKVAPYYSLNLVTGYAMPSKGEWMTPLNLVNDLGVLVQPWEKHRFIGFYELKYSGPGLRRQEGEKFTDRLMDHVVVLRHHYALAEDMTLKSQIDYMKEYKRTGANEVWGKGLYDFDRYGGALTLEKKFAPRLSASVSGQYHSLAFPNYTDLLAEWQAGGESQESSTGKQNQNVYQAGLNVNYGQNRFSTELILMSYTKQKVVAATVQPDGTYYSSDLQQDTVLSLGLQRAQKLFNGALYLEPSVSVKLKGSNQNYQQFEKADSTVPVQYVAKYYDYQEFNAALPVTVGLSRKWEFFVTPEWDLKMYTNRPPRDPENKFLSGLQINDLVILSLGFTLKPNDITRTTFFYTYQTQSSNMKFEKYLPYNYSGSYFGVSFNYSY